GSAWRRSAGLPAMQPEDAGRGFAALLAISVLGAFVVTLLVGLLPSVSFGFDASEAAGDGAFLGGLLWLGLSLPVGVVRLASERGKGTWFAITQGHRLVELIGMGLLAAWLSTPSA